MIVKKIDTMCRDMPCVCLSVLGQAQRARGLAMKGEAIVVWLVLNASLFRCHWVRVLMPHSVS